jgi:hypothetical protein
MLQPVGDVLRHRHVGKERVVLEQQPDIALIGPLPDHGFACDLDDAFVGILEAGDEAQRGGLAAAAGPQQRDRLAGGDRERHVVDCGGRAEPLVDVAELDHGLW